MRWLLPLMVWALVTEVLHQIVGANGRIPIAAAAVIGCVIGGLCFGVVSAMADDREYQRKEEERWQR